MSLPGPPLIVGIGPGDPDSIPAAVFAALADHRGPALAIGLAPELIVALGAPVEAYEAGLPLPDGALVLAIDPAAQRLAVTHPDGRTIPDRVTLRARAIGAQIGALATVGERLRLECPWDRRQTPETIVPHTVEEAFEVAEAVFSGDPVHVADEIGDLLFQSVFLAQFLEEDGEGDLGTIARGQADKLISRHPHVYGEAQAAEAAEVLDIWDSRKRVEREGQGIFHELPPGLPALHLAAKVQKRAASVGFRWGELAPALVKLEEEVAELRSEPSAHELGDVLFAAIAAARELDVDPELALRGAAIRFRDRVETAALLAKREGIDFERLDVDQQLGWYQRAREAIR
ncbi:MAG: nucleoside triphosphate pyrophosphohydrolase [Thermoleophilia bacterium]|nr:nucleoside triphosphate pyrophosphohydrolase [Thermoleophilia bacterium]MDH3724341.1 nucleoside triphosphate pyrophosphohydrolase [Thermoleophilia bacterium]